MKHRALWWGVVQSVERWTVNPYVTGSIPVTPANCFGNTEFGDCNTDRNVTECLLHDGGKVDRRGSTRALSGDAGRWKAIQKGSHDRPSLVVTLIHPFRTLFRDSLNVLGHRRKTALPYFQENIQCFEHRGWGVPWTQQNMPHNFFHF